MGNLFYVPQASPTTSRRKTTPINVTKQLPGSKQPSHPKRPSSSKQPSGPEQPLSGQPLLAPNGTTGYSESGAGTSSQEYR
ncbi:hypothetical protein INT48_006188 [Thamnidium elegans]|uniref:Uncharacterized protein n=1 Tax=Thamnidium elegans TaxID=101142 RepID=A0A8H7SLU5_9FUNG|nr:hypothetical protein INT48_006188 [Thamnidium elegans]